MVSSESIGAFLFCSKLPCRCLYLAGKTWYEIVLAIIKQTPVNGGESFSSRASRLIAADKLPPADVPPTMKPFDGLAFNSEACPAIYVEYQLLAKAINMLNCLQGLNEPI